MNPLLTVSLALVTAVPTAAQAAAVAPRGNHGNDGASWHFKPYHDTNQIFQQLLRAADVPVPPGTRISAIAFVREAHFGEEVGGVQVNPYIAPPVTFDRTEIRVGERPAGSPFSSDSAANWGGSVPATPDWAAASWTLPGYTSPGPCRQPVFVHALAAPLLYAGGDILVEVRHVAGNATNSTTGFYVDRTLRSPEQTAPRGHGCLGSNGRFATVSAQGFVAGSAGRLVIDNPNPPPALAALWFGFDCSRVLGHPPGVPLARFVPGVDPFCQLWTDVAVAPIPLAGAFPLTVSLRLPDLPGLGLGAQCVFADPAVLGGLYVSESAAGWLTDGTAPHGSSYAYFVGDGDTSAANPSPPTLRGPYPDFDTLLLCL